MDDLHLKLVRTTASGVPAINEVLAEATIDWRDLPISIRPGPFTDVDLSKSNIQVTAGDVLAIALSSDQVYYLNPMVGTEYAWYRATRNKLSGGEYYIYSPLLFGP